MSNNKDNSISNQDQTAQFEAEVTKRSTQKYTLRLYISGATPRSTRAIDNIRKLCDEHLKGCYELEVIDIYQHPEKARSEQVIAAPTLIKHLPLPLRKYIGDLSDSERVLVGLEIKEKDEDKPADKGCE
jgi:circadian clock protein KaiB